MNKIVKRVIEKYGKCTIENVLEEVGNWNSYIHFYDLDRTFRMDGEFTIEDLEALVIAISQNKNTVNLCNCYYDMKPCTCRRIM